jgi:hypothetical protein
MNVQEKSVMDPVVKTQVSDFLTKEKRYPKCLDSFATLSC